MSSHGHPIVAATLDTAMAGMAKLRAKLIPQARGRVLEIGVGTGMNLPYYPAGTSVIGIEPDPHMRRRALARAAALGGQIEILDASAEALPFDSASFDTVVATWVLCTIPDPVAAARELRRVLRPGGQLIFAEHTRSEHGPQRWIQNAINPAWKILAGGCHLNRDSLEILRDAGFELKIRPPRRTWSTLVPTYRGTGT